VLLVPGKARNAAGEAAASPATPGPVPLGPAPLGLAPPEPVGVLAQAVTRQAARQADREAWCAASARQSGLARCAATGQPLKVSMFSIFHRPPWRRAVTANMAPA
jgi:hypothetical protein